MRTLTQGVQIHIGVTGTTTYYYMGRVHREDGPAVIHEDHQMWFHNGKPHREDGPAFVDLKNKKATWYLHGQPLATADFIKHNGDLKVFESYIHKESK